MTKKALILLLSAIGGAVVISTTATVVTVIVVNNNKDKDKGKTTVDKPKEDKTYFVYDGTQKIYKIDESEFYTITGNKQTNAGTYTVSITLKNDKYVWSDNTSDTLTFSFIIDKASVVAPTVDTSLYEFEYDGTTKGYQIATSDQYTISGNENVNPGSYTAVVALNDKNNYKWENSNSEDLRYNYTIKGIELNENNIAVTGVQNKEFTGEALTQNISVTYDNIKQLVLNTDYTISYESNVNAGTAKVIITGIGHYSGTVEKTFTITPKPLDAMMLQQIADQDYTGNPITPVVLKDGTITLVSGTDYDIEYQDNVQAGQASFTVTGKGNYSGSFNGYFTIVQQQAVVDDIIAPTNLVYNGQAQALFTEPDYNGGTLKYSLDNGQSWTETLPTKTNAGSYTIKYKVFGSGTTADSETKEVAVVIAKAESTAQAPTPKTGLVYTGSEQVLVNAGTNDGGTWLYSLDGVDFSEELPTGIYHYSGSITVYYKFVGDANHNDKLISTFEVPIAKATPTVTSFPAFISSNFDYDGQQHELITDGVVENGHFEYMIENIDQFYTSGIPTATTPGTYVIHYMVKSDDEHYDDIETYTETITVTVNKLNIQNAVITLDDDGPFIYEGDDIEPQVLSVVVNGLTVPTTDYTYTYQGNDHAGLAKVIISINNANSYYTGTAEKTFTIIDPVATPLEESWVQNYGPTDNPSFPYNGNAQAPEISLNDGTNDLVENVDYTINITGNQTDAGEYTITITGTGSYTGSLTRTYTITKVDPTVVNPQGVSGLAYTGSPQNLVTAGTSSHGTWMYSLDNNTWSETVPTAVNADEYIVYYRFDGDKNHNDIASHQIVVTIDKVHATVTIPTIKTNLIYTGSAIALINAGSSTEGQFQYKLENEANFTNNIPTGINAGTYKVYYQFVGDSNHYDESYSEPLTIVIDKADAVVTNPQGIDNLAYTGSAQALINAGTSQDGHFEYSLDNNTWSETIPQGTDADEYIVYYRFVGDPNHNDIAVQQIVVNIDKANATAQAPEAETLTYNGSIQNLVSAGANDGGTWQYKLNDGSYSTAIPTEINAGTYTVYFKFIGDANHYDIPEASTQVTIAKLNISTATVTLDNDSIPYAFVPVEPQVMSVVINTINISNTEYSISYLNNDAVGTAKVIITITNINGNFTGSCEKAFAITDTETTTLIDSMVQDYTSSFDYDGTNHVPTIVLKDGDVTLVEGTDYTLTVSGDEQINAGTYTITITGEHFYVGQLQITYTIEKIATTDTAPVGVDNLEYNTSPQALITAGTTTYGTWWYKLGTGNYSTNIPQATNAGTYTIYYKFMGDTNHSDIAEDSLVVEIARTDATIITESIPAENLTYTGSAQKLMTTGNSQHGHYEYSTDGETWSTTIPTGTNAGNYTVYYKFVANANYKDIAATSTIVNIAKANPTVTEPTPRTGMTYNGTERTLVTNYSSNHGTWMYSLDDSEYSETIPAATKAGTYTIKYKFVGDANHKDIDEVEIQVTIAKATSVVTNPTAITTLVYDGTMQSLITAGSSAHGDFLYSLDGENYSDVIPTGINAETYTVYYKFVADSNHINIDAQELEVTIALANSGATAPEKETGLAYTGSAQALVEAGTNTNGHWEYKVDGEYSEDVPTATNAGTYRVYYKFVANTNYKDIAEAYYDVEIAKVNCSYTSPSAKQNLIYDGTNQELITGGTVVSGGEWQYKLEGGEYSTTIPTGMNYGSYKVYYKLVADSNHNGIGELSYTITISKAVPTYTSPTKNDSVYTGNPINLVIAGESDDGTYEYSTDNETWSTTIPQATVVGSYKVYYRFIPDGNHSTIANGNVTTSISKANPVVTSPTAIENLVYTGEALTLINAGTGTGGSWQYKIGSSGNFTTDIPQETNAGTYTIFYKFVGDDNHNDIAATSFVVEIAKKQSTYTAPTAITGLIYDGTAQDLIVAGSSSDGTWKYKLDSGIYTTTIPTATTVGTYTVSYKFEGDSNHTSKDDFEEFTITISKATPVVTAPVAVSGLIYNGSSQELITAGSTTGGTLQYRLSTSEQWITTLPKANAADTYTIYYKVVGDTNYLDVAEQSVEVTIAKKVVTKPAEDETVFTYNGEEQTYQLATSSDYNISGTLTKIAAGTNNIGISLVSTTNMVWDDESNTSLVYAFTINKKQVTVTLLDQEADWTGQEPTISSIAYSAIGVVGTDNLGLTIAKASGTAVGTYNLTATINNANYILGNVPEATFTINKVAPTSTATPAANNFTYDNNTRNLVTQGTATGGTYYYKLGDGEYSTTIPSAKDAGSYTITYYIKGDGNHLDSAETEITVTIAQAKPSFQPATVKVLTYTGEAQSLVNAATTSTGTPMYSLEENDTYTTTIPTGTNAGTYRVWYYIDGDANHLDSAKAYLDVTIKKAEVTKPTESTTEYTYTGTAITHTLATSDYYTITNNSATNVGEYTATVTLNDTDNYCWKESEYTPTSTAALTFDYEITPKALTAAMVTLSTDSNVYNGENQKPTVTVADSEYMTASDYTITNNGGTNVGNYTVTVEATGNYTGSIEKTYTITARPITITLTNQNSNYLTNGAYVVDQTAYTTGSGELITGDDLGITITKADGTDVGSYQLTASITNDNYDPEYVNATYTINSQGVDIAEATILLDGETTSPTYTYNGLNQTPIITISGKIDGSSVDNYDLVLGEDYTITYSKTNRINSGTYTITITAKGNYFTGTAQRTYSIEKKTLTDYTLTFNSFTYDGTQHYPATTGSFTLIDNDLDPSVANISGQYRVTSTSKNTAAGTGYTVTINVAQSSQYNSGAINGTYDILRCDINDCTFSTVYAVPFTSNVETNGYFPEPTITLGTYDLIKNTDYTLSWGTNNQLGTGTVTITGIGNFQLSKTIEFEIMDEDVTLSFDPDGGTLNDSSSVQNVTFEYPYDTPLPTPTKAHYDFVGWSPKVNSVVDTTKVFNSTTSLDELVGYTELVAQWTLHNYTITYGNVSGENTYGNPTTRTYADSAWTLLNPSDPIFMGWYTDQECTEGNEITVIPAGIEADLTIYAKWNVAVYTITYNTNGGNEVTEHTTYSQSTSTFYLPTPTRDYYDFVGWYTNSSLTGDPVTQITQGSSGDKEFWAKWTPTTYYINYNYSGGTEPANPTTYTYESSTITLIEPTKGGNIFVGWFTSSTGGTQVTEITQGSHGTITLWARYTPIPTSFEIVLTHDESGSSTSDAGTISGNTFGDKQVGDEITPLFTVSDTYTFLGWYNGDSLVTSNPSFTTTLTDTAVTYTAKVARYRIVASSNSDGGSVNAATTYVRSGDTFDLVATTTLGGYVFYGWFLGAQSTEPVTTNKTLTVTMGDSDLRYFAKWSHVTLTKQNSDGTSNNTINPTGLIDTNYIVGNTVTLTATCGNNYAFRGWYSGDTKLSGDLEYTYTFKNTDDALYAKFVKNQITVTPGFIDTSIDTTLDDPQPYFILSTGGNYGTASTNNVMDENELVTYTATNNSSYMFAGWYEVGETGITIQGTTYSLISRATSIKLAPGTIRTIYPLYIVKLGASSDPYSLQPTTTGGNYSGDPVVVTPQSSDAYEFTKYTIDGIDVASDDPRLSIVDGKTILSYTEDLDTTLSTAANLRNRVAIIAVYTRTSALIQVGKLVNSTFVENESIGTVAKNGNTYTPTAATGYEFVKWQWQAADGSNNRQDVDSSKLSGNNLVLESDDWDDYFAIFQPLTTIDYTVNYYLQDVEGDGYTIDHTENSFNNGITDESLTITPGTITGATLNTSTSQLTKVINGNGSTVYELYFDRDVFTVQYQYNNGTSTSLTSVNQRYGSSPEANEKDGWGKTLAGWYTDPDLGSADEFTGFITEDVTLYAKWDGDLEISDCTITYDIDHTWQKVVVNNTSYASIVIPSYYNGYPVTIVDINNLVDTTTHKIYSKVTLPETVEKVVFGTYNGDVTWIVLDKTNGYKLLSEDTIGNKCKGDDTTLNDTISGEIIKDKTVNENPITYSLLSVELFNTYSSIINTKILEKQWWLSTIPASGKRNYVKDSGSIGSGNTASGLLASCYIRPYIEV